MPKGKQLTIQPAKGRPMLHWVGKRPLRHVTAFPAQHVETYGKPEDKGWKDWPKAIPQGGLLFHGDNKEVLAHLLASGFRGKVDLIYIDPPFDSGADYVRKVQLRAHKEVSRMEGEGYSLGEQSQYTDIWANDNYLQFMFERLILLSELLSKQGVIFLHCDWHKSHHLRCLLDEVFGAEAFSNEIVWHYFNKMQGNINRFASNHDTILVYRRGNKFRPVLEERKEMVRQLKRVWDPSSGSLVNAKDESGNLIYIESSEKRVDDVWRFSMLQPADQTENTGFITQKPESILEIIIGSSSEPGDLVLDCFLGSGTTAAVAQKLGRRWIGCDINKSAIQTASKRLAEITAEQQAAGQQGRLIEDAVAPPPAQQSFAVYRVNDYDLQIQHNEAVELACQHIGIERTRSDAFFDGLLGKRLVKIVPLQHPLSLLDLEEVRNELTSRPEEERDIVLVCLGKELATDAWLSDWNRLRRKGDLPNKIEAIELRTDPRYGSFFVHKPTIAKVKVARKDDKIQVRIEDFISPSIVERLKNQSGPLLVQINDWRSMVDTVMIDPVYDGKVLKVGLVDVPEKKDDLITGEYVLDAPKGKTTVAVKITDMLGEETLVTVEV